MFHKHTRGLILFFSFPSVSAVALKWLSLHPVVVGAVAEISSRLREQLIPPAFPECSELNAFNKAPFMTHIDHFMIVSTNRRTVMMLEGMHSSTLIKIE